MMSTPLPRTSNPPSGQQVVFEKCAGANHKHAQCPNLASAKDAAWTRKTEAARAKPCSTCGGCGHWSHHHPQSSVNQNAQQQALSNSRVASPKAKPKANTKAGNQPLSEEEKKRREAQSKIDCKRWLSGSCRFDKTPRSSRVYNKGFQPLIL